jgi:colanic acid/amylovoran biosynthesis glycosyltransferase
MNIAFFVESFPKLSETFIINQVTGLIDDGHDVTVFAIDKPDEAKEHAVVEEYDLLDRTVYAPVPSTYTEAASLLGTVVPRLLARHPERIGDVLKAPSFGDQAPHYLSRMLTFLDHDEQFDICHAHFGTVANQYGFVSDLEEHGPFVVTFYGRDVSGFVHPDNYDAYTDLWPKCDRAIGITQHVLSRTMLLGCPESKTTRLHIGVDTDEFERSPIDYPDTAPLRLLSVARHVEKKGLKYAIDAVADCLERGVAVEYAIAGDGPLRSELERRVADHGIGDSVEFLGWQTQSEVRSRLHDAHLFVQPSVTARDGDMEGQALVIQEAQATGTPVVATYHDGIPEGLEERETGRLVPERDAEALARAIEFFEQNPESLVEYGENARSFVEANFDNTTLVERQAQIYADVIDERGSTMSTTPP